MAFRLVSLRSNLRKVISKQRTTPVLLAAVATSRWGTPERHRAGRAWHFAWLGLSKAPDPIQEVLQSGCWVLNSLHLLISSPLEFPDFTLFAQAILVAQEKFKLFWLLHSGKAGSRKETTRGVIFSQPCPVVPFPWFP